MDIDHLLTATRSARKTLDLDAPVDLAEVRECLRVGLQAANGSNSQTWRWLVVVDPALRKAVGELYRDTYLEATGGRMDAADRIPPGDMRRIVTSSEWLVEHITEVPLFVIPCYTPNQTTGEAGTSYYYSTLYGSIFPAVWNFQLALHTRGYGTCITTLHLRREAEMAKLLGIPDGVTQGCLLPVAKLQVGRTFTPAPRLPIDQVVSVDSYTGTSL